MGLLLLISCAGIHFEVSQSGSTVVEGGGLLGELLGVLDFGELDNFDVSVEQKLADQGVQPGDLTKLHLTAVELNTPDGDLDFLESLDIYVEAKDIPAFLVAEGDNFSEQSASLSLTDADLVEALLAGSLSFTVEAVGEPPPEDTTLKMWVDAEGWATPKGAASQL